MNRQEEGRHWRLLRLRTIDAQRAALDAEAIVNKAYVACAHGHGAGPSVEELEFAQELRDVANEAEGHETEFLAKIFPE